MMQHIKMKSILANPYVTAAEKDIVEVSRLHPDADKAAAMATELVAGGYAEAHAGEATRRKPQSAEAMAAEAAAAEAKRREGGSSPDTFGKMTLESALRELDPADDEHWTKSGKPSMTELERLLGDKSLSRADVEKAFPDFRRPDASADDWDDDQDDDQDNVGGEKDDTQGSDKGPRSNKP